MKHPAVNPCTVRQPLYPGAADAQYFARRALEILTAIVTGTGAVTIMLFLAVMA